MKLSKNLNNWMSITGIILAINSSILIVILFIISLTLLQTNAYIGIYIYMVLPALLVTGMLLIPIGAIVKMRKRKGLNSPEPGWPSLDLNNKKERKAFFIISIISIVFIIVSAVGSYQAFHYSESVEFCGKLCHSVMEPEYVTYLNSPHAKVKCVECHVGEGADWYVKSKMSGLYQVYAVIFNKYPRPIETPIKDLRPARETCEKCHWPEKFYSSKLRNQTSFLADSLNTEWSISMVMKTGPSHSAFGLKEGIHWHINPNIKIEYVSPANNRESIPWVKMTNLKTGEVEVFHDTTNSITAKTVDSLSKRTMDCMDCHNRPSHSYKSAPKYIDYAMVSGVVPANLPYAKQAAMGVLKNPFTSLDTAMMYIRDSVNKFYRVNYPTIFASSKTLIDKAIQGIQSEFKKNDFPFMRANSTKYLNHIGHLESNGCFRCHTDRHVSNKGKKIPKNCNLCHTIIAQGPKGKIDYAHLNEALEFNHPVDVGD